MREQMITEHEREPIRFTSASIEEKKCTRLEGEPSQDCIIVDDDSGIYGVFDGLGAGGGRPELASAAARDTIAIYLRTAPTPKSFDDMLATMQQAFCEGRWAVTEYGEGGLTTATVAWHARLNDEDFWVLGNAGDSRSYLYDPAQDMYESLTKNQGDGRVVTNCFQPSPYGLGGSADEFQIVSFDRSMRLMLCTDGITGDTYDEMLTDEQFLEAFEQADPATTAQVFYDYSIKIDDKSVVVVDGY